VAKRRALKVEPIGYPAVVWLGYRVRSAEGELLGRVLDKTPRPPAELPSDIKGLYSEPAGAPSYEAQSWNGERFERGLEFESMRDAVDFFAI
jgi:hypothetical protein